MLSDKSLLPDSRAMALFPVTSALPGEREESSLVRREQSWATPAFWKNCLKLSKARVQKGLSPHHHTLLSPSLFGGGYPQFLGAPPPTSLRGQAAWEPEGS